MDKIRRVHTQKMTTHSIIPAVNVILQKEGKIFLIRRCNTGWSDGLYTNPAGHIENGEFPIEAAIREAKEEADVVIEKEDLALSHIQYFRGNGANKGDRISFFFTCGRWVGEPVNAEPHKCDDASWFEEDALPENLVSYIARVLGKIKAGEMYSEFIEE